MASIVLMTIARLLVVAIVLVASMIVTMFVATMLLVAQLMAACDGQVSRLLLFCLLFVLGDLLKNTSCFVGCLTLLENGNELKRVCGHHLVCIHKIKLMRLGLRKEDLFTLLVHCGYLHCLSEVATIKVAHELYSTLHELMHWHEDGLLGST
jgi:hypothetical protein